MNAVPEPGGGVPVPPFAELRSCGADTPAEPGSSTVVAAPLPARPSSFYPKI